MTHDTWCGVNILSKLQLSSSNYGSYDDLKIWRKRISDSVNQLTKDEAACRTARATPGLLTIMRAIIGVGMKLSCGD